MKVTTQVLSREKDGLTGYLAFPERSQPGPGLLMIHHHLGITGHQKAVACDFARLGYTTLLPDIYELLGGADHTTAQKKIADSRFVEVTDQAWRYLQSRKAVDARRVGVVGYCMGGRIGIHFVAATPSVRAFVGYYPSVHDEERSDLRPRHPNDAAREIKCPSLILYGGQDHVTSPPCQQQLWSSFLENGQPLEWHFFSRGQHGFALADGNKYDPNLASLAWPLVVDFFARELDNYC